MVFHFLFNHHTIGLAFTTLGNLLMNVLRHSMPAKPLRDGLSGFLLPTVCTMTVDMKLYEDLAGLLLSTKNLCLGGIRLPFMPNIVQKTIYKKIKKNQR